MDLQKCQPLLLPWGGSHLSLIYVGWALCQKPQTSPFFITPGLTLVIDSWSCDLGSSYTSKGRGKEGIEKSALSALLVTSLVSNRPMFYLSFCLLPMYLKNSFFSLSSHHSWSWNKALSYRVSNSGTHFHALSFRIFTSSRLVAVFKAWTSSFHLEFFTVNDI